MLASITPLGERGRQSTWGITVGAFLLAAVGAGVLTGAALGWVGWRLLAGIGPQARLAALAGVAVIALALDALPMRVPGPRRQVDERWRTQFRGWVWGGGYGAQLGVGVGTVVQSAATYLALSAAVLSGGPGRGAVIVGLFGLARGLQPLATWRVRRPDRLVSFHARLGRWRGAVRVAGCGTLAAILALAVAGLVA
jgi:hypothetical protein